MEIFKDEKTSEGKAPYEAPVVECIEMVMENSCLISTSGIESYDEETGFWD